MAERAAGAAADGDDFVLVWLGVGLGLATILGGQLHRGTAGAAGEIGYLPVHGAPLRTDIRHPASGGFQSLAGGSAVRELAAKYGFAAQTPAEAVQAALAGANRDALAGANRDALAGANRDALAGPNRADGAGGVTGAEAFLNELAH